MDTGPLAAAFANAPLPGVVSAYLFGSHAMGGAHRESDVDIGVLLDRRVHPRPQDRFEVRLRLIAHISQVLRTDRVDLVVLDDAPPHLARRVMLEGQRVFCADSEIDHAARRTAMLRAPDLEPFLRRTRRVKLQAIAR